MSPSRSILVTNVAETPARAAVAPERTALTGCPWHDVKAMLREVRLRRPDQRMALGWILFGKGDRHITAEMLYEEATKAKVPVSLATIYNALHQFTDVELLRQVAVDGSKTYFDTNSTQHHHFFVEGRDALLNMRTPTSWWAGRRPRRKATKSPASTWWCGCDGRAAGQIPRESRRFGPDSSRPFRSAA